MKRQKEAARKRKQLDKSTRRAERAAERKDKEPGGIEGEDPDIAGIIPGPQPLPEEYGIIDDFRSQSGADDSESDGDEGEGEDQAQG